jgi:hypothetical protein
MCEKQNTIVCAFDLRSPRISACEIHECIYIEMCLNDQQVTVVQIDGHKRHVCINLRDNGRVQGVLHSTRGQAEYRHTNGAIFSPDKYKWNGNEKSTNCQRPPGSVEWNTKVGPV